MVNHDWKYLISAGWLHIGTVDRFPSSRTGYTISCWLKVNYFLSDEAGLFGWQDTTKHCVFEVYFKTFTDIGLYPSKVMFNITYNISQIRIRLKDKRLMDES